MTRLPVSCTLSSAEQAKRQKALQDRIGAVVESRIELDDGYALRLPAGEKWIREAAELIVMERACCPFLTLELTAEPARGPVWLKLRGPEGTKEFLQRAFTACGKP